MGNKNKFLLIENDLNIFGNFRALLEKYGFEVIFTNSGKEAIEIAKETELKLIFCDTNLPDCTAKEVYTKLKGNKFTASVPTLFISDSVDYEISNHLTEDDFILKPIKIDQLLAAINLKLNFENSVSGRELKTKQELVERIEKGFLFIENGKNIIRINTNEIVCLLAEGNYTIIIKSDGKKIVLRKLLKDISDLLKESDFLRIHRSTCINLDFISKIEKWRSGTFQIHLKNYKDPLKVSRNYSKSIRSRLL